VISFEFQTISEKNTEFSFSSIARTSYSKITDLKKKKISAGFCNLVQQVSQAQLQRNLTNKTNFPSHFEMPKS
jgi:hypothetical protein